MGIQSLLNFSLFYKMFTFVMGDNTFYPAYIKEYIRPKKGDRILDIGCGPADILKFLTDVDYVGIDSNAGYIQSAMKKYGGRGSFLCKKIGEDTLSFDSKFNIIMANGVLHHLNDEDALALFKTAKQYLEPKGRMITGDACLVEKQSWVTRLLFSLDRGKFIRTRDGYMKLLPSCFSSRVTIRYDLTFYPFTFIIMECGKAVEQTDSEGA
jgi:SAM-dependent methyltransferase